MASIAEDIRLNQEEHDMMIENNVVQKSIRYLCIVQMLFVGSIGLFLHLLIIIGVFRHVVNRCSCMSSYRKAK